MSFHHTVLAWVQSYPKTWQSKIRPVFEYMMSTLGLVIKIPSDEEIERINQILERRNELREQKKYAESDALRDELGDMNVEIIDEVGHTIWMIKDN